MAWTLKSEVASLERAAQMRAFEADCLQSVAIVNDHSGDVGKHGPAVDRIIVGRANIEFGLR